MSDANRPDSNSDASPGYDYAASGDTGVPGSLSPDAAAPAGSDPLSAFASAGQEPTPATPVIASAPPASPTPPSSPAPSMPSAPEAGTDEISYGGSGSAATPTGGAMSTAQAGALLRRVGIGNPLPTFVVGAAAYIAALVTAVLVALSVVAAVLVADTGDLPTGQTDPYGSPSGGTGSGSSGDGWRVILALLGIPFQLVSQASFGSYVLDLDLGFFGSASASWRGLPLLITLVMVSVAFLGAKLMQKRFSSNGPLGALLWSLISGFAVAVTAALLTRITALHLSDADFSVSMHSAGFDMFLGTWVLISAPIFLGHVAGWEKPSWWPLVEDLFAAPRLVLVHAMTFAVPLGALMLIGGMIKLIIDGDGNDALTVIMLLPLWGPSALAVLPALGLLSVPLQVKVRGDVPEYALDAADDYFWFFDLPWYVWVPMVALGLLLMLIIPLLWNRNRVTDNKNVINLVASALALPIAYFLCSLILIALVWTKAQLDIGMLGEFGFSYGIALWMPVVAFFLGVVIELLARFGAPFVDRFLPGVLLNWFRRSAVRRREAAELEKTPAGYGPSAADTAAPSAWGV